MVEQITSAVQVFILINLAVGVHEPTLTLTELGADAPGRVRCVVSTACDSITSDSAADHSSRVRPRLRRSRLHPDVNHDNAIDQDDISYLIDVIAGGDNSTNIDLDFNHDGNADQDDINALINVIAGGECP